MHGNITLNPDFKEFFQLLNENKSTLVNGRYRSYEECVKGARLNTDFVRITKHLSLRDLKQKLPEEVYKIQVSDWIIAPAKNLASLYPEETDHGMALLAIQLMFFEPHGQFLSGKDSEGQSKKLFVLAFDEFINFMEDRGTIECPSDTDVSKLFYKFARCGLFHSSIIGTEILVSVYNPQKKVFFKNPILDGWLVDPWLMLGELENYLAFYLSRLDNDKELYKKFETTYNRLFEKHLSRFDDSTEPH